MLLEDDELLLRLLPPSMSGLVLVREFAELFFKVCTAGIFTEYVKRLIVERLLEVDAGEEGVGGSTSPLLSSFTTKTSKSVQRP